MDSSVLQAIMDIIFKGTLLYLSPILLILGATVFGEKLIDLIYSAVDERNRRRT
ncbi:hypothetical protein [Rossellomorea marisflavi]|uniref:hypothetical protein n=1 Tax=Rossellomorea marisflavi TaxID=189381 RepID=UPI003D2F50CD